MEVIHQIQDKGEGQEKGGNKDIEKQSKQREKYKKRRKK